MIPLLAQLAVLPATSAANPLITYLPFLAIAAPIAMFWGQVQGFIRKVFSFVVVKTDFEANGQQAMNAYLNRHGKRLRLGQARYSGFVDYTTVDKRHVTIGTELPCITPQLFKIDGCVIAVKYSTNATPAGQSAHVPPSLSIYSLRGTFKAEQHYLAALAQHNGKTTLKRAFLISHIHGLGKNGRDLVGGGYSSKPDDYTNSSKESGDRLLLYTPDQIGYRSKADINTGYVFCDQAQRVVDDCKRWRASEEWYRDRGILYRRGFLLNGPAGTGKSSLVRKICQIIDVPLFIFDLASLSNAEMLREWKSVQSSSPCAVLFDDLDRIFEGATNRVGAQGGGLTFDCLLGCLSGAMPAEGVLVFATVNDPTKLDPALGVIDAATGRASRPGRFDAIVTLGSMNEVDRRKLAVMIFGGLDDADVEGAITAGEGMTAAQFNDHCAKRALELYWSKPAAISNEVEHPTVASQSPNERLLDEIFGNPQGRVQEG